MNDCEFSFKQSVIITEGFYRGFNGIVYDFRKGKNSFEYLVKLEVIKKDLWIEQECLKKRLVFKIPFLK